MHASSKEEQDARGPDQRPGAHEESRAESVGERAETARQREHHDRHGERRQAALQRAEARDLLQEDDEEEEENREPGVHRERLDVADREVAAGEEPELEHRVGGTALVPEEERKRDDADGQRDEDHRARPAVAGLLDQREHESPQAESAEAGAERVDVPSRDPATARDGGPDQRQGAEDEGRVQREDPTPGDLVDDPASREGAGDRGDRAPSRPGPDRRAPFGRRERGDDDRKRARRHQCSGRALERTRADQHAHRRRERAGERQRTERRHAEREHAPLAVDVAQRAADQDQRAQRQEIGVRHPLLSRQATAEVALDRR